MKLRVLLVLLVLCGLALAQTKSTRPQKKARTHKKAHVTAPRDTTPAVKVQPAAARDTTAAPRPAMQHVDADTLRRLSNVAFGPGEYLHFEIKYGFVTAADAILRVRDTVYNSRKCFVIDFTLSSKPFFDAFYRVRDHYLSIMDSAGLFPWKFEQHIREGGFSRDFTAEFDQVHNVAVTSGGRYKIPAYVHDMMSAFYFVRTLDLSGVANGQVLRLQNFYKDSVYELGVKFRGRQTVETDVGKFNCIVIEPLAKEGGLFKSDGKVFIWLTDDERKIPVIVTTKIPIGNIDSELVEYVGIVGPIRAKVPRDE